MEQPQSSGGGLRRLHYCYINTPVEYYSPDWGGAISTVTMQQSKHLIARGHKVSVMTMVDEKKTYAVGEVVPVQVGKRQDLNFSRRCISRLLQNMYSWDYPYFEIYLNSIRRELKKLNPAPDVVIINNDLVSSKHIKNSLPNAKVVVWLQNAVETRQRDISQTIANTFKFVAVSSYIKEWTCKTYGVPDHQIDIVQNGVDLDQFYPRDNYLEPNESVGVLFLGRLIEIKSPDIVADAVAALRAEGLPVHLSVAGDVWWQKDNGRQQTDQYQIDLKKKMQRADTQYLGLVKRPDVPQLVRSHDVVCVLSRWPDPCPLVTFEAMASGCAVLASNMGGIPEQCGNVGLVVDPNDLQGVISALRSLATDPKMLKDQKELSIRHASHHSWTLGADWLEKNTARI